MKTKLFYGAGNIIFENAKALRNNMTQAEMILWGFLKTKPNGYNLEGSMP